MLANFTPRSRFRHHFGHGISPRGVVRCPFVRLRSFRRSVRLGENKAGRVVGLLKDIESGDTRFVSTRLSIGQRRCQERLHLIGLNFDVNVNNQHATRLALRLPIERRN